MDAQENLLRNLAEAEVDVQDGRGAPMQETFDAFRAMFMSMEEI